MLPPAEVKQTPQFLLPEDLAAFHPWIDSALSGKREPLASLQPLRGESTSRVASPVPNAGIARQFEATNLAAQAEAAADRASQTARFLGAQARRACLAQRRSEMEQYRAAERSALGFAAELRRFAAQRRACATKSTPKGASISVHPRPTPANALPAQGQTPSCDYVSASGDGATESAGKLLLPGFPAPPCSDSDMQPQRFPQRRDARAMTPRDVSQRSNCSATLFGNADVRRTALGNDEGQAGASKLAPLLPAWLVEG